MVYKILAIAAFILSSIAVYIVMTDQEKETVENPRVDEYPLLESMGYYQRFSHKLWLAVDNKNWALAEFYVHELEEVTEEFIDAGVSDEGQDLSALATTVLKPQIEQLDAAIDRKNEGDVVENFKLLIQSCNACHTATNHAFIKIQVPESVNPFNQDFGIKK